MKCVSCQEEPCHPKCAVLRERERERLADMDDMAEETAIPDPDPYAAERRIFGTDPAVAATATPTQFTAVWSHQKYEEPKWICACEGFNTHYIEDEKCGRCDTVRPRGNSLTEDPGFVKTLVDAREGAAKKKADQRQMVAELVSGVKEAVDFHKRAEDRLLRVMARAEELAGLPIGTIIREGHGK